MQTFRPAWIYLRVSALITLVGFVAALQTRSHYWELFGFALVCALAMCSSALGVKLTLSDSGELLYSVWGHKYVVNLNQLTSCNYRFIIATGSRGALPHWVIHLYDSSGGYATFSANIWFHKQRLYSRIRQGIETSHLSVDHKTAKRLGLTPPEQADGS